jgi:hypothetical protein
MFPETTSRPDARAIKLYSNPAKVPQRQRNRTIYKTSPNMSTAKPPANKHSSTEPNQPPSQTLISLIYTITKFNIRHSVFDIQTVFLP